MRALLLAGFALLSTAALAADIASGPTAGEAVAPLPVYDATGPNKEKELDYAAARKEKPTVYVLIREWDRPVARFLKFLDNAVKEDQPEGLVVAVWLTDRVPQTKEYLPRAQQSLQLQRTALTVFPGDRNGPNDWDTNPDARVTAIVAGKGKVAASFGYRSINDTDVPEVRAALKKTAEEK